MKLGKGKKVVTIEEITNLIEKAPREEKSEAIAEAIQNFVESKYAQMTKDFQTDYVDYQASQDEDSKFNLRSLDSTEMAFYDKLINQKLESEGNVLLPVKTVNYVFEDLKLEHPLFKHLDFVPAGVKEWFTSEHSGKATWGKITSQITSELDAEIKKFNADVHMISAFMYVPKGILDLGHKWVDRYVRTILQEVLEEALEEGFLTGDGNGKPIGMDRDLTAAVNEGVYTRKTPIAITDFGADSFNKDVLPTLNKEGKRVVNQIIVAANQQDIDTIIFKATHVLGTNGYTLANLPKKFVFVPSAAIKQGEAIAFLDKTYIAGVDRLGVDTSKDYKFLERLITYAIVGYGDGRPKTNDCSVLLDIKGLLPLIPEIKIEEQTPGA